MSGLNNNGSRVPMPGIMMAVLCVVQWSLVSRDVQMSWNVILILSCVFRVQSKACLLAELSNHNEISPVVSEHSQRGLIRARSLTKSHIERIKHPAYDFNNVWGHTQQGWSQSGMLMKTSKRALGGDFRSREIIEKYDLSVCLLSSQYVNLLIIYLFICGPPAIPPSITFFHAIHPTRGLSMVSAGMTAYRKSLRVFTWLDNSLLVRKHYAATEWAAYTHYTQTTLTTLTEDNDITVTTSAPGVEI